MPVSFEVMKSYSFESYNRPGQVSVGWKLTAVLDMATSIKLGYDVAAMHAMVLSAAPPGSIPRDPSKLKYYLFRTPSGRELIEAYDWIKQDTASEFSNATVNIVVSGSNISVDDMNRLSDILQQNGYTTFTIDMVSN